MQLTPHSLVKNGKLVGHELPFKSFAHFLKDKALKLGQKPALIFEDFTTKTTSTFSYQDLDELTTSISQSLTETHHLTPKDRFSFAFHNTPEILLLNYAAWRAGLVTVPLDVKRDTIERKIYKLKFTKSQLLITRADALAKKENREIRAALPDLKIIEVKDFSDFKKKLLERSINQAQAANNQRLNHDCLILFTSGTTALPKGVRLTVNSLFANAQSIASWMKFDDQDRFHVLLPLHHINSITFTNTTLFSGGTVVLSPRYSKSNFWPTMAKHSCTGASIVPTIAYDLLSETSSFKKHAKTLKSVRRIQIGSAPVQPQIVEQFMQAFSIPLIQGYGQTETSLRSTGVPMDLSTKQYARIRELNSLGTELKYSNVTILSENGKQLPEGEVGDICVRGPVVMPGYLNNPSANQEAFEYDWFHSGDTGYFKNLYGRKFFFIEGRTKEVIHKGGILISPLAVENALLAQFRELDKVYAVGFPDARLGQEIGIVTVTKNPHIVKQVLDAAKACAISGLSPYESPRAALQITEAELPKTSTGKIQRLKIKDIFGPKLLEEYRTIAKTNRLRFRAIGPEETPILKQALKINNIRWGKNLTSNLKKFTSRAQNGLLLGAFDSKNNLFGTVSAIHINNSDLGKQWAQTWDGVTSSGTLSTHNHKGDTLLCVAISTKPKRNTKYKIQNTTTKKDLTASNLDLYLKGNLDPVIAFHRRPKAGLKSGAKIIRAIDKGRPTDKDALGYNVLMQYPTPTKAPTINSQATIGTQLIEAALLYAYTKNLKHIYVYSRPATLNQYFTK